MQIRRVTDLMAGYLGEPTLATPFCLEIITRSRLPGRIRYVDEGGFYRIYPGLGFGSEDTFRTNLGFVDFRKRRVWMERGVGQIDWRQGNSPQRKEIWRREW